MLPTDILILNGPNLNLLGKREPDIYGKATLEDLHRYCMGQGKTHNVTIECRQSNLEGELITWVQNAKNNHKAIIINAGGYSHSSVALRDSLTFAELPLFEVHISNIYAREEFRHHSVISSLAIGVLCGFGFDGYGYAIDAAAKLIKKA